MMEELSSLIEKELNFIKLPNEPNSLYEPVKYSFESGGKRLRPLLVLLSAGIFGSKPESVIKQAAALEILHNFTLVHDDIMDEAPLRRGRESVYKKWDENSAILAGDVMFAMAVKYVISGKEEKAARLSSELTGMAIKLCEGQRFDLDFGHREIISMQEYLTMIELKTAWLIGGSLKIGAIAAGASESAIEAVFNCGIQIGLAFQLMDDYLDIYGDPEKVGKQTGGDVMEAKKTYFYVSLVENSNGEDVQKIKGIYRENREKRTEKIPEIRKLYDKYDLGEALGKEVEKRKENAIEILKTIPGDGKKKMDLIHLTENLTKREF